MEKKRVLFIQQEVTPFVEETPMSTIGRYLPQGIQELGREIRIFMPRYGKVNERRNQLHEVIRLSGMNLIINDKDHPLIIKVASIQKARMQIYFIDNDDFFSSRKSTFFDKNGNFFNDNDDRIVFFSRGVIETVKKLNWSPDIIHCHGWFTSLVPLYIKCAFIDNPLFSESKVIYSLYDDAGSSIQTSDEDPAKFVDDILSARTILYRYNVTDVDDLVLEVSPDVAALLLRGRIDLQGDNKDLMESGCIGRIFGMKVYASNNIFKDYNVPHSETSPNSYHKCILRTKRAIAFAEQLSEIEAYRPELRFADAIKGLHLYGAKVVYPNEMVLIDVALYNEV